MTLVFGGWPRESRRQTILQDLQKAIRETDTESLMDDDPFTTGARTSIALANFWPRSGEESTLLKRRLHNIISAFNKTAPKNSSGNRIWTSFSKTQQERKKGAHANWIKRLLKHLNVDEAHAAVDVEHSTGSAWLGATKVAGSGHVDKDDLYVDDKDGDRLWLHVGGIARELGTATAEVDRAVQETRR